MKKEIKTSVTSSNFWTNISTIVVLGGIAVYQAFRQEGVDASLGVIAAVVVKNFTNILYHLNKVQNTVISTDLQETN